MCGCQAAVEGHTLLLALFVDKQTKLKMHFQIKTNLLTQSMVFKTTTLFKQRTNVDYQARRS